MTTHRIAQSTRSQKYLYGAAVLALLILGSVAAIATAPRALTWSVPSVSPTVLAGGASTTTTVSLTAEDTLPNAVVQISPSLTGLVSASPMDLATIPKGRAVTLTLTSSAPASSTPGVVQGYIQIVKENPNRQTYGKPLPVSLTVTWPNYSSPSGFEVAQPPTFTSREVNAQKVILVPSQENAPDIAPIFIEVEQQQRGPTLYDHLQALGIDSQNIAAVNIGGRSFLKFIDYLSEGDQTVGYVTQFSPGEVLTISSLNPLAVDTPLFQAVLSSISF